MDTVPYRETKDPLALDDSKLFVVGYALDDVLLVCAGEGPVIAVTSHHDRPRLSSGQKALEDTE